MRRRRADITGGPPERRRRLSRIALRTFQSLVALFGVAAIAVVEPRPSTFSRSKGCTVCPKLRAEI
jgi:hypothetical protein